MASDNKLFPGQQKNIRKLEVSFKTREEGSYNSITTNPYWHLQLALIPNSVFNVNSKGKLLKELSSQRSWGIYPYVLKSTALQGPPNGIQRSIGNQIL